MLSSYIQSVQWHPLSTIKSTPNKYPLVAPFLDNIDEWLAHIARAAPQQPAPTPVLYIPPTPCFYIIQPPGPMTSQ